MAARTSAEEQNDSFSGWFDFEFRKKEKKSGEEFYGQVPKVMTQTLTQCMYLHDNKISKKRGSIQLLDNIHGCVSQPIQAGNSLYVHSCVPCTIQEHFQGLEDC